MEAYVCNGKWSVLMFNLIENIFVFFVIKSYILINLPLVKQNTLINQNKFTNVLCRGTFSWFENSTDASKNS